jgi:hypothetical protein
MSSTKKPILEGSEEFLKHAETTGRHTQARFRCYISESQRYEGAVEKCVEDVDEVLPWGVVQRVDMLVEEESLREEEESKIVGDAVEQLQLQNGDYEDQFQESDDEPAISCSICRDGNFIVPRITKCGHVFCYLCIAQYLLRDELTGNLIIDGQARVEPGSKANGGGAGGGGASSSSSGATSSSSGGGASSSSGGASSSSAGAGSSSSSAATGGGGAFNALVYSAASFGADVGTGFIDTAEQALISDFQGGAGASSSSAPGSPAMQSSGISRGNDSPNSPNEITSLGGTDIGTSNSASNRDATDVTTTLAVLSKNSLSKTLSSADRKICTAADRTADLSNTVFTSPYLTASSRLLMTRLRKCPVCNTKICLGDLRSVKFQKVLKNPAPSSFYLVYKDPQRLGITVMAPHSTRDRRRAKVNDADDNSNSSSNGKFNNSLTPYVDRHTFTISDHARLRSLPREGVDFGWYFARIVLMSDADLQRMRVREILGERKNH